MKNSKVTVTDIASKAQVSIATVSRIINNKGSITPKTRQRVYDAMEELGFTPKTSSMLSTATSKVILLCIPTFNNPFNAPVIDGIQRAAHSQKYDVLILETNNYYSRSEDFENILKNNSIAGILIMSSIPQQALLEELSFRCPIVMCSEYAENFSVSYVSIDDVAAAKKAVKYLISTGRKKIGLINSNSSFKYARHREKGYTIALEEANFEINPSWIVHLSTINYSMAVSNIRHILTLPNRPDALFACSDVFAVAAVNVATELGLNVPEDVSIIGFDNIDLSVMCNPPITTIEQPCFQLGYQSCELLLEKIKNPSVEAKQILLNTELIVRGSTTLPK